MKRDWTVLLFHVTFVTFAAIHLAHVLNWPLALSKWYWVIPLLPLPFLPKKVKYVYSAMLIYAFATLTLHEGWPLALFLPYSLPETLALLALLGSLVYSAAAKSIRAGLATLCCITGLYLHYDFSLLSLYLHLTSVFAFSVFLLHDLHWIYYPINQLLLLHRRLNKVV